MNENAERYVYRKISTRPFQSNHFNRVGPSPCFGENRRGNASKGVCCIAWNTKWSRCTLQKKTSRCSHRVRVHRRLARAIALKCAGFDIFNLRAYAQTAGERSGILCSTCFCAVRIYEQVSSKYHKSVLYYGSVCLTLGMVLNTVGDMFFHLSYTFGFLCAST